MQDLLVTCDNLIKIYKVDDLEVVALQGLDLEVAQGEMIAIVGASGSGKTTLLNLLAGLDRPSAGRVVVAGHDLAQLTVDAMSDLRLRQIGVVFQSFNLFPSFTVAENVALPLEFLAVGRRAAARRAA